MSTIPAAIDALLTLFDDYPALAGVQVIDGPPAVEVEPDVIVVGFSLERVSVDAELSRASLDSADDQEIYEIVCLFSSERGDPDLKAVRDRCFEMVNGARNALADDPTLGGTVISARLTVVSYDQAQTETGPSTTAEVVIRVMADVFD